MYSTILFDLDGTLTDSRPGITRSVQYALAKMGIDEPDPDNLIAFIGPPLRDSFRDFYGMKEEEVLAAIAYYRERYSTVGLFENAVYPGIPELWTALEGAGKTLWVATSKPTVFSVRILEKFGLLPHFRAVIGSHLDSSRESKGDVIAAVLEEMGEHNRGDVVMVGDRKHDIVGARENNIAVIGVEYGYGGMEELTAAAADKIVATVQELQDYLLKG